MKNFGKLIMAAILGSVFTIASFSVFDFGKGKTVKIEQMSGMPVKSAMYTVDDDGQAIPLDFTKVAGDVMDAVVHIKSTQTIRSSRGNGQMQDPFNQFFNDDFFEHFFGPGYRYQSPNSERAPQVRQGAGSGVIITEDGYIVTNNHVVKDADDLEVTLHDNRTYKAKLVGTDPSTDLALIQIKENDLVHVPLVNSDEVKVGEWVLAIGNPFNLNSTVTAGIVSAKGRNINIFDDQSAIESFIQTDAAINPGNSGGALVNLKGGLIGINTAIASPTGSYAGYGFAVPSNIVSKVVYDIMEYGTVQRGYLGVMIRDVNAGLAKEKGLDVNKGVFVDSLVANSAAKNAGIKEGDVITKVNDANVETASQLQELIARHRPGDEVNIEVDRQGSKKTYQITLNNKDGKAKVVAKKDMDVMDILGIEVKTIDEKLAKKLEIDGGVQVVKLKQGKIKNETNIREGFVITRINGRDINDVESFEKEIQSKNGGIMLEGVYEDYPDVKYYAFGMK